MAGSQRPELSLLGTPDGTCFSLWPGIASSPQMTCLSASSLPVGSSAPCCMLGSKLLQPECRIGMEPGITSGLRCCLAGKVRSCLLALMERRGSTSLASVGSGKGRERRCELFALGREMGAEFFPSCPSAESSKKKYTCSHPSEGLTLLSLL